MSQTDDQRLLAELRLTLAEQRTTIADRDRTIADLTRQNIELREAISALLAPGKPDAESQMDGGRF